MLSVVLLSHVMLSAITLRVVMSAIMLRVVIPSAIMLSGVATKILSIDMNFETYLFIRIDSYCPLMRPPCRSVTSTPNLIFKG